MIKERYQGDLVVLVADKNMEFSVRGVLERPQSLGIKKIDFVIYTHPKRDPGCYVDGHNYLLREVNRFRHALVMFDREGCGREKESREILETEIEARLAKTGWNDRAAAIVIDPELEVWLWSDSPELDSALGWQGKSPSLRTWLREKDYFKGNSPKPSPPKNAVEEALKKAFKPRSASIFYQVAKSVSLKRCEDPAFMKLKEKLSQWFKISST